MSFPQIFQPIGAGIFSIALWNSDDGPIVYVTEAGSATNGLRHRQRPFDTSFFPTAARRRFGYQGSRAISAYGGTPERASSG